VTTPDASPVEDHLDALLVALDGPPRQVRAQLAEAEAHLWDATAEGVAEGLDRVEAERRAVARFGPVSLVAEGEAARGAVSLSELAHQSVSSGLGLAAIGGIAIGISAVITWVMGAVWGDRFVATDPGPSALTASNCARWLAGTHALTCRQAAIGDWAHDTVLVRAAAGVVGLAALAGWFAWRRWTTARRGRPAALAPWLVDALAAAAFGVATVWLVSLGVDAFNVDAGHGAGQWLGAAPVALVLAVVFGLRLLGHLRRPDQPRWVSAPAG
jgi:hypothetical protein